MAIFYLLIVDAGRRSSASMERVTSAGMTLLPSCADARPERYRCPGLV